MRKKHIDSVKPGEINGKTIYSFANKQKLLNSGIAIEAKYIKRLKEMGVGYIYVEDEISEGIDIQEMVPDEVSYRAKECIQKTMNLACMGNINEDEKNIKNAVGAILDKIMCTRDLAVNITDIRAADDYTFGHSVSVCTLSIILGISMGLNGIELRDLGIGALLHDIGKIRTPPHILKKPGKLTEDEAEIIKKHTTDGFEILRKCDSLNRNSVYVALAHHERCDGSGYPHGIKMSEMNVFTRIVSIADVFDAMCADRVYRKGLEVSRVLRYLNIMSNRLFDGEIVGKLAQKVLLYPNGTGVYMNTGEKGIVAESNLITPHKPVVRLCYAPDGKRYDRFTEVDLDKNPDYYIIRQCEL
jgi:putative nucleotidyltransferase with HDIG domain